MTAYAVPVDTHRRRGCPQLEISRDQLEYLVSLSFNWTQIAAILGVSRMTVYRRRREFGMLDEPRTNISDGELLVFVEDVRRSEPESGEVIVMGELRSHGYRVTCQSYKSSHKPMQWSTHVAICWTLSSAVCDPPCENGVCDRSGNCTCEPGWTGSRCRIGKL